MRIAYLLYDGMTLLDFVGFYDPVARLRSLGLRPDLSWDTCALRSTAADHFGLTLTVDRTAPDLADYGMIFLPGGFGSRALCHDPQFIGWLRTAAAVPYKVSVCTGSLLLGAAGFLAGQRATTHAGEYATLAPYAGEVVRERIVPDGRVITGGGVAAALDLGLYVCEQLAGAAAATTVRRSMNYLG